MLRASVVLTPSGSKLRVFTKSISQIYRIFATIKQKFTIFALAFVAQRQFRIAKSARANGVMLEWLKRHAWKACNRQKRFGSSNLPHSALTGCPPHGSLFHLPPKKSVQCPLWKLKQNLTPIKSILIRFTPYFFMFLFLIPFTSQPHCIIYTIL